MRGCRSAIWTLLLLGCWAGPSAAATPQELLARIKAVGPEGKGSAAAAAAWRELVALGPSALVPVLQEFDDSRLVVVNWLRPAVDAIAERAARGGEKLPAADLEAFLAERKNPPLGRRAAYELLVRLAPKTPDRWLPKMLDDPSPELRREAVARVLSEADKQIERPQTLAALAVGPLAKIPAGVAFLPEASKPPVLALYRKALNAACDSDQVETSAAELAALGHPVDLPKHYGFVGTWALVAPFDNTGMAGFAVAYPPEKGVDLKATYTGKGDRKLTWGLHTADPKAFNDPKSVGVVNLKEAIGPEKGAVAYAFTIIDSPAERPVEIRTGCLTALKIFLNGKPVFAHEEYHHGMNIDQYVGRATLKAGKNELLVKVCQNEQTESWAQEWMFQLRLCDSTGVAVPFKVVAPAVPPLKEKESP